jgi:hypothetical protein
MTDADVCAQMSLGEPIVGLAALTELRSFLDSWRRDQTNSADRTATKATLDFSSQAPEARRKTESRWEAPE